jgi:RNA polymerase sigma-32 factor
MSNECDLTYVREIDKYPFLTRDEEIALAKAYRERGELRAAHKLVVSNLRFVVKVAHEYRGYKTHWFQSSPRTTL